MYLIKVCKKILVNTMLDRKRIIKIKNITFSKVIMGSLQKYCITKGKKTKQKLYLVMKLWYNTT